MMMSLGCVFCARRWLPAVLALLCAALRGIESPSVGGREKGKAEVRLPGLRTIDWQVRPYFSVEGAKMPSTRFMVAQSGQENIDLALQLQIQTSAGTNARWSSDISLHFMPDESRDLVQARDQAQFNYRFDDGLFWTGFDHTTRIDYDLDVDRAGQWEMTTDRFSAGQRFQTIDWGVQLDRQLKERCENTFRERADERVAGKVWFTIRAADFLRPSLTLERHDIDQGPPPEDLRRVDGDGQVLTLSADGTLGDDLSWHGRFMGEQVSDPAWGPVDGDRAWERTTLDTGVTWTPGHGVPRLNLSFTQEQGYETERRYQERSHWLLGASRQIMSGWQARAHAGFQDELDAAGRETKQMTAGIFTTLRLSPRAELSGEYRYAYEEKDMPVVGNQMRFQLKMQW